MQQQHNTTQCNEYVTADTLQFRTLIVVVLLFLPNLSNPSLASNIFSLMNVTTEGLFRYVDQSKFLWLVTKLRSYFSD